MHDQADLLRGIAEALLQRTPGLVNAALQRSPHPSVAAQIADGERLTGAAASRNTPIAIASCAMSIRPVTVTTRAMGA
jgi:hypothetical protein